MYEIIPGILQQEWIEIEKRIEIVKPFAKTIHIDILDGIFAPNKTFLDPSPFKKYSDQIFFELHMMVDDPIKYLKPFANAGFKRFIGHIEKMPNVEEFVAQAQLLGEVGLAIDGPTPIDQLKVPLDDIDNVLIMTITAGFSGQSFMPEHLEKVRAIREKSQIIPIEIDGGVSENTIPIAKKAGVTRFAATSAIYKGQNPPSIEYKKLAELLK